MILNVNQTNEKRDWLKRDGAYLTNGEVIALIDTIDYLRQQLAEAQSFKDNALAKGSCGHGGLNFIGDDYGHFDTCVACRDILAAEAATLERAAQSIDKRAASWQNVDIHAELVNEAMTVRALLTDPQESALAERLREARIEEIHKIPHDCTCNVYIGNECDCLRGKRLAALVEEKEK